MPTPGARSTAATPFVKPSGTGFSAGGVPFYAGGTNFYNALQTDALSEADVTAMLTTHWNEGARCVIIHTNTGAASLFIGTLASGAVRSASASVPP